jgi:hypothetical protein
LKSKFPRAYEGPGNGWEPERGPLWVAKPSQSKCVCPCRRSNGGIWAKENVIALKGGLFWGFGGSPNPASYKDWLNQLLNAYNKGLGKDPNKHALSDTQITNLINAALQKQFSDFGFNGTVEFWDLGKIGQKLFTENSKQ